MSGTRVTIELPEALRLRLEEASQRAGSPLNAVILRLIEQALLTLRDVPTEGGAADVSKVFDPQVAARRRRARPILEPPLSQTAIEGREDRV